VHSRRTTAAVLALVAIGLGPRPRALDDDPFASLKPSIAITPTDRRQLDARQAIIKILPAADHELAVLAAGSLTVGASQIAQKINDIAVLKRNAFVPEIGRFSSPPKLTDLDSLTLDDVDQQAIGECRPGDCDLKLSSGEIDELHQAKDVVQVFRQIVLKRVHAYLERGLSGIPEYATGDAQVPLPTAFGALLKHAPVIQTQAPHTGTYLQGFPRVPAPSTATTFLYWSKEKYAWKPIISVTHVTIVDLQQSGDTVELLVASKEVFATRYTSGALVLTCLLRGADSRAPHYLVYLNRTWVDGLRAIWRPFVNFRVKSQARRLFEEARARLER
jgi:hypothetical protein